MRARRSVWADDTVQELLAGFVTVADEVGRLQRGGNAENDVFRSFCELGHYGGRTKPTDTRQGIYAVAPSGKFLASVNTTSAKRMAQMLRTALERWAEMPPEDRTLDPDQKQRIAGSARFEDRYPTAGLVLAQYGRDLAASVTARDWQAKAWNEDQAWFTEAEAVAMVPDRNEVGARVAVPRRLVERLACLHLIDNVRGQTPAYRKDDVAEAELHSEIVEVDGQRLRLHFLGKTLTTKKGRWRIGNGSGDAVRHERGVKTKLSGRAVWNRQSRRFESFELLAIGQRWGATQYNARASDLEPTPIGFAFVQAPEGHPRVAPTFWWLYGWK